MVKVGNGGGEGSSMWGMVGEKGRQSGEWWGRRVVKVGNGGEGRRVVKVGNGGGEGWSKWGMVGEKGGQSGSEGRRVVKVGNGGGERERERRVAKVGSGS